MGGTRSDDPERRCGVATGAYSEAAMVSSLIGLALAFVLGGVKHRRDRRARNLGPGPPARSERRRRYTFTDFWKFGLPLPLWFEVVSVLLVPVFWGF